MDKLLPDTGCFRSDEALAGTDLPLAGRPGPGHARPRRNGSGWPRRSDHRRVAAVVRENAQVRIRSRAELHLLIPEGSSREAPFENTQLACLPDIDRKSTRLNSSH